MEIINLEIENGEKPTSFIALIPGEIEKTELFINCLVITTSHIVKSKSLKSKYISPTFLDVIQLTSFLSLPSSIYIKKYFEKENTAAASICYSGLAMVSSLESKIQYTQDFMLRRGTEGFLPIEACLK